MMTRLIKICLFFAALMGCNAYADLDLVAGRLPGDTPAWENGDDGGGGPLWMRMPVWDLPDAGRFSVPAMADLDGDGDFDALIGVLAGRTKAYENVGTREAPVWVRRRKWDMGRDVGVNAAPGFGDLDNDGLVDLMVGSASGIIRFFRNTGSATKPQWTEQPDWTLDTDHQYSFPRVCDLDHDGDLDLASGTRMDGYVVYRNVGTAEAPQFEPAPASWSPPKPDGDRNTLAFGDLDGDGDCDALLGNLPGFLIAAENIGGSDGPAWVLRPEWDPGHVGGGCATPYLADLDGDGGSGSALRADAGADRTVVDEDEDGAEIVTLDGTGSSSDEGTIESYAWSEKGTDLGVGEMLDAVLGIGKHVITLTVTDDQDDEATDTVQVTVKSPAPPPSEGAEVTFPSDAGIAVSRGTDVTVTWTGYTDPFVRVQLYKGTPPNLRYVRRLTPDSWTENDGSYTWSIPSFLKRRSDYFIRVFALSNSSESDFSDHPFEIK